MEDVIVTEKLDGECTTMYPDYVHARSVNGKSHPSRNWVKNLQAQIGHLIPAGVRICGENLFAKHSIYYTSLESYFAVFAAFDGETCLSWDDTVATCHKLSMARVPLLYRGPWDEKKIKACWTGRSAYGDEQEGYVVRNAGSFSLEAFDHNVAKFVRQGHVQTDDHWLAGPIERNELAGV